MYLRFLLRSICLRGVVRLLLFLVFVLLLLFIITMSVRKSYFTLAWDVEDFFSVVWYLLCGVNPSRCCILVRVGGFGCVVKDIA